MLGNMFNKKMMEKMQGQMEETKHKLKNITVVGEAENGNIKVVANGNRMLDSIEINSEFYSSKSKEEDFLLSAKTINKKVYNND